MRQEFHKLVRDRIPEIIRSHGDTAVTRVLTKEEFAGALREKLLEEVGELRAARTQEELMGEVADMLEVLEALLEHEGITWDEVTAVQSHKREKRGGFSEKVFLEYTE